MKIATLAKLPSAVTQSMRGTADQDQVVDSAAAATRRHRRFAGIGAAAIAMILALVWLGNRWSHAETTVPYERVRIARVTEGSFIRDVAAQGTIVAAASPTVFAPTAGTVTLLVRAGESVTKGQPLADLDSPELRNEYEREQATLESLEIDLKRQSIEIRRQILTSQQTADIAGVQIVAAERELKRAQDSWNKHVINEIDYAKAQDDVSTARLNHNHAIENAALEKESLEFELRTRGLQRDRQQLLVNNLRRRVDELSIRAPVAGVIGNLATRQKAAVEANTPILTVVDLSAFEVEFKMPESYAGTAGVAMPAEINLGGTTVAGSVTAISPEVVQGEVTGRVRFNEQPTGLRQSQRVAVRVILDQRSGILKVERGPFVESGGKFAYIVRGDLATRTPITLGAIGIGEVEVLSGLKAGDEIVVSSLSDLKDAPQILFTH